MTPDTDPRSAVLAAAGGGPMPKRSIAHLIAAAAVYAACGLAAEWGSSLIKVVAWFAMAWVLTGNAGLLHEATHGLVFGSRRANRWLADLAAASLLVPAVSYRWYHIGHHVDTMGADDPEMPVYLFQRRAQYLLAPLTGPGFLVVLNAWALQKAGGGGPQWFRGSRLAAARSAVIAMLAWVAFIAAAITNTSAWLTWWAVPLLIALLVVLPGVLIPEHYGAAEGTIDPLHYASTVYSNRFVEWVYWANNLHAVHHLAQDVVPQRRHAGQQAIEATAAPAWVASGYIAWHIKLFRSLGRRAAT